MTTLAPPRPRAPAPRGQRRAPRSPSRSGRPRCSWSARSRSRPRGAAVPALALCAAAVVPLVLVRLVVRAGISPWAGPPWSCSCCCCRLRPGRPGGDLVRRHGPRRRTPPPHHAAPLSRPRRPAGRALPLTGSSRCWSRCVFASPHRVAPVLGASTLYVAGALLTVGEGDRWGLVAALLLAASVLGWILLDQHREPTPTGSPSPPAGRRRRRDPGRRVAGARRQPVPAARRRRSARRHPSSRAARCPSSVPGRRAPTTPSSR